jgi:hypothetical protein
MKKKVKKNVCKNDKKNEIKVIKNDENKIVCSVCFKERKKE